MRPMSLFKNEVKNKSWFGILNVLVLMLGDLVNTPGSFDSNHDRIKGHGFLAQTE